MVLLDRRWLRRNGLRVVVHAGALLPLAWLVWAYVRDLFLVDPVREITTLTGKTALILLLLSLAGTPLDTLTGWQAVGRLRRALGLYATLYAGLHFLTFVWLDYGLDPELIRGAIFEQRYVVVGLAAGLILLALALTSTPGWQRRLGKNWKRLHRLAYLAGILAISHFLWLVKDAGEPLRYAALLALLLLFRLPRVRQAVGHARKRLVARWGSRIRSGTAT